MNRSIVIYHKPDISDHIHFRRGERKLGEAVAVLKPGEGLENLAAYAQKGIQYALLGIPESIGPLANHGRGGAERSWGAFLGSFLNMQSNRFLPGENILCLGHIDTLALNEEAGRLDPGAADGIEKLRQLCALLDERVAPVVSAVVSAGLIPVIIGGGHNNSYPILKGVVRARGADEGINAVNCDPHADFRALEGRHSGNGFSYAYAEGYLYKYFIFGLHEAYNAEGVMQRIDESDRIAYSPFDAMQDASIGFDRAVAFFSDSTLPVGLELDLDALGNMPSSAVSPSGFSVEDGRRFVREMACRLETCYLHLAEGAPQKNTHDEIRVGKTLAYLVHDFIKARRCRERSA